MLYTAYVENPFNTPYTPELYYDTIHTTPIVMHACVVVVHPRTHRRRQQRMHRTQNHYRNNNVVHDVRARVRSPKIKRIVRSAAIAAMAPTWESGVAIAALLRVERVRVSCACV